LVGGDATQWCTAAPIASFRWGALSARVIVVGVCWLGIASVPLRRG
jgi:hypothetical protein